MQNTEPLSQPQRLEAARADAARADELAAARIGAAIAGLFGFLCFMPYPAIPAGMNTAIQFGSIMTALIVIPVLFDKGERRAHWMYLLLVAPLCISALKVSFDERGGDLELCFKTILAYGLSVLTLVAVQRWAPRHSLALLTGIAIATVIHVGVGVWQFYAFSTGGDLPLQWLYQNPSFLSVQENAQTISLYIQRPFGIFPEPSAMATSLAPFVLFWIAELCGIVKLKAEPARWQRILFSAAAAGGLCLIILSQSGHTAVTVMGILLFLAIWFVHCRASAKSYLAVALVFGIAMPVTLYFAAANLGARIGGESELGNSSWEDRTDSMKIGFSLLVDRDLPTIFFGAGVGLTAPEISRIARLEAVWSVLLTFVYETGLVGLIAITAMAVFLLRQWKSSGKNVAYATIVVVWTVGITITTSYTELLPVWIALGWISVWPSICHATAAQSRRSRAVAGVPVDRRVAHPLPARRARKGAGQWISKGWREPAPLQAGPISPTVLPSSPSVATQWSAS